MRKLMWITSFLLSVASTEALAQSGLAIQGGWWSAELEYLTSTGLFLDLGVPWMAFVLDSTTSGIDWTAAGEAKVGFQHSLDKAWKVRYGVRHAVVASHGCPCSDGHETTEIKPFLFFELGLRYLFPSGFLLGLDIPVLGFKRLYSNPKPGYPPVVFAFAQGYIGYTWGRD